MSLKPKKISDLDKDWMHRRRKDNKKVLAPEYHLIVTEGTVTEPDYFNRIKEIINEKFPRRIQINVEGKGDNTVNLFYLAKNYAESDPNGFKHVWIVYDTDSFPAEDINKVVELCKNTMSSNTTYHAIWSNECFELWYLLHFSYMHSNIHRTEYYKKLSEILQKLQLDKYVKNRPDMFDILRPYMEDAINNAKKLNVLNNGKTPADSNPGTQVYQILEILKPYLNH